MRDTPLVSSVPGNVPQLAISAATLVEDIDRVAVLNRGRLPGHFHALDTCVSGPFGTHEAFVGRVPQLAVVAPALVKDDEDLFHLDFGCVRW